MYIKRPILHSSTYAQELFHSRLDIASPQTLPSSQCSHKMYFLKGLCDLMLVLVPVLCVDCLKIIAK